MEHGSRADSKSLPLEYPRVTVRRTFLEIDDSFDEDFDDLPKSFQRAQTEPVKVAVAMAQEAVSGDCGDEVADPSRRPSPQLVHIDLRPPPMLNSHGMPPKVGSPSSTSGGGSPCQPLAAAGTPSSVATPASPGGHLAGDIPLEQLRALQEDPELAHVFQDIRLNGMAGLQRHYQDDGLMLKICRKISQAKANAAPGTPGPPLSCSLSQSTRDVDESNPSTGIGSCNWSRQNTGSSGEPNHDQTPQEPKSVGSIGHPEQCGKECVFFFWRSGCKADKDCKFCHEFHPRHKAKKNRRALRRFVDVGLADGIPKSAFADAGIEVPSTNDALKDGNAQTEEVTGISFLGYNAVDSEPTSPSPQARATGKLVLPLGQKVHLPAYVVFADGRQQGPPLPWLRFAVDPSLPRGLLLDEQSGLISGAPEVEQASLAYTITACTTTVSAGGPFDQGAALISLATCVLNLRTVDLQRYCLSWGSEERTEGGASAASEDSAPLLFRMVPAVSVWKG
jgi:hypothetical protein